MTKWAASTLSPMPTQTHAALQRRIRRRKRAETAPPLRGCSHDQLGALRLDSLLPEIVPRSFARYVRAGVLACVSVYMLSDMHSFAFLSTYVYMYTFLMRHASRSCLTVPQYGELAAASRGTHRPFTRVCLIILHGNPARGRRLPSLHFPAPRTRTGPSRRWCVLSRQTRYHLHQR